MPRTITDGNTSIGAFMWADRKKPTLCVQEGNQVTVYGTFNSVEGADEFMTALAKLVGAAEGAEG